MRARPAQARDNTGDIRSAANIKHICESVIKDGGRVDLVTADGGTDPYAKHQEERNYQLAFCQMVAALGVLARGGSFVLKVFSCLHVRTLQLVFFMSTKFESVALCKPAASTPGNNERYVVASGFRGIETPALHVLHLNAGRDTPREHLVAVDNIPAAWLKETVRAVECMTDTQMAAIQKCADSSKSEYG
jgi:cap2 methyltransferase